MLGAYFASIDVTIRYSDKGNYFVDTLRRFGSLDEAGAFIKAPSTRSILEKFLSKANSDDGEVIYLTNDQRAYLNFGAFCLSVGDETRAATLVDELVGKQILERGYILQCERCRLSSWYSLNTLTSTFTCTRCSFSQQFTLAHWKQPVEPYWYYRLAETVYQFYLNNSHLTAQTLYKLKSESRQAFHYAPEIDLIGFPGPGAKRELDIACVLDGQIVIGECKTEPLQGREVSKFESLLRKLGKSPSRVVFATTHQYVSDEFISRITGLRNSEVLTFGDLYDT
jgi:hypothetical protein